MNVTILGNHLIIIILAYFLLLTLVRIHVWYYGLGGVGVGQSELYILCTIQFVTDQTFQNFTVSRIKPLLYRS